MLHSHMIIVIAVCTNTEAGEHPLITLNDYCSKQFTGCALPHSIYGNLLTPACYRPWGMDMSPSKLYLCLSKCFQPGNKKQKTKYKTKPKL